MLTAAVTRTRHADPNNTSLECSSYDVGHCGNHTSLARPQNKSCNDVADQSGTIENAVNHNGCGSHQQPAASAISFGQTDSIAAEFLRSLASQKSPSADVQPNLGLCQTLGHGKMIITQHKSFPRDRQDASSSDQTASSQPSSSVPDVFLTEKYSTTISLQRSIQRFAARVNDLLLYSIQQHPELSGKTLADQIAYRARLRQRLRCSIATLPSQGTSQSTKWPPFVKFSYCDANMRRSDLRVPLPSHGNFEVLAAEVAIWALRLHAREDTAAS